MRRFLVFIGLIILYLAIFVLLGGGRQFVIAQSPVTFSNITDNRGDYEGELIPKYEKLEITFQISNSVAGNFQFPYEPNPPAGIDTNLARYNGISVNAVFTNPQGQIFRQPAFYFQDFEYQIVTTWKGPTDWIYPTTSYSWKVRFAPTQPGIWQYYLEAQDKSNYPNWQVSAPQAFTVTENNNRSDDTYKGFIRVSPNDSRYFAYDNGDWFTGLGYNENYRGIDWVDPVQTNRTSFNSEKFDRMKAGGINLIRIWWSEWAFYGSWWGPWSFHSGNGYLKKEHYLFNPVPADSEVSIYLDADLNTSPSNPCIAFEVGEQAQPALKRGSQYRLQIRYKIDSDFSPKDASKPYGLVTKWGGWLWSDTDSSQRCYNPGIGTVFSAYQHNATLDWQVMETTFTANNDYMDRLYLVLENVLSGRVYIESVSVQEILPDSTYGANVLYKGDFDLHLYFDQRLSYAFDLVLNLAKQNNVYLRPVLSEKNDWILDRINLQGLPDPGNPTNDNFYGDYRNMSKTRWLLQAYWRYVQARWGYSPNIHSWELVNEGDPWSSKHYALADEFGKYMSQFTPDNHLASTSNWTSFPKTNFWANANYPNMDFADFHRYYASGVDTILNIDGTNFTVNPAADFNDSALLAYSVGQLIGANAQYGPHKPVVQGECGFYDSDGFTPNTIFQNDTSGLWLHNFVWGNINASGVYLACDWYPHWYIYKRNSDGSFVFDHRSIFGTYSRFVKDLPLGNGHYEDANAPASAADMRVWGQKDMVNGRAHLWIANKNHTWRNVYDNVSISPLSGSVTVSGFTPSTSYPVEWWDTYTGQPTTNESLTSNGNGELVLTVSNLTSDTAVRIGDYTQPPAKPGDLDHDGDIDAADYTLLVNNFGTTNCTFNVSGDCVIDIFDFSTLVGVFGT